MNWTDRRWFASFFLLVAVALAWIFTPQHPDSSYLRARYAQNLIAGDGFAYNPDEKILLTSAPLMVLAHALTSLPAGEISGPPMMLTVIILALGAAALMQILLREKIRAEMAFAAALIWLLGGWVTFGGVETWLASFSFVAFYLAGDRPRWAGLVCGLMLLIAPLAIFFVILLGAFSDKKFWQLAFFPAVIWYGFAFFYFGPEGLRGLTLVSAPGEGFPGAISLLVILPLIFWLLFSRPTRAMILVVWGLGYSLVAVLFNLTSDTTLLISAGVILAADAIPQRDENVSGGHSGAVSLHDLAQHTPICRDTALPCPKRIFGGGFANPPLRYMGRTIGTMGLMPASDFANLAVFTGVIVLALMSPDRQSLSIPDMDGSKGHIGGNREAFLLGGTVVQLDGTRDPHLRELVKSGDTTGLIIATAPDFLLISPDNLPDDPALNLLGYHPTENALQRRADVFAWNDAQSVEIDFGPDMRLTSVQKDRTSSAAGEIVRLRLDWHWLTNKRPESRLLFILQVLDGGGAVVGSVEQSFSAEKWAAEHITTYHVLPLNDDALPGLYDVRLAIDLDAGIIDRRTVTQIKIPAPSNVEFDNPPLAHFDDGTQMAELMHVETDQQNSEIVLYLVWRAGSSFDADYIIFVHLTAPNDPSPLAQTDAPPLNGRYPTSIWEAGEVISDSFVLPLADVPPGDYVIRLEGFFHPEHGRIPTNGGDAYVIELTR